MKIVMLQPQILLVEGNHPVTVLPGEYDARSEAHSITENTRPTTYIKLMEGQEAFANTSEWRVMELLNLCAILLD